jgi:hypothetical protein
VAVEIMGHAWQPSGLDDHNDWLVHPLTGVVTAIRYNQAPALCLGPHMPAYSTDERAAHLVLSEMMRRGAHVEMEGEPPAHYSVCCWWKYHRSDRVCRGGTFPYAVCRAALDLVRRGIP